MLHREHFVFWGGVRWGERYISFHRTLERFHYKLLTVVVSGCAVLYFVQEVHTPNIDARVRNWKKVWPLFKEVWWFGVGIGNWKIVNTKLIQAGYIQPGWIRLHNTFIQATVEMGAGFLVLLAGYIVNIIKRLKGNYHLLAPLAAIVIVGNANSVFRMNTVNGMIIVFWLAYIERTLRDAKRDKPRKIHNNQAVCNA